MISLRTGLAGLLLLGGCTSPAKSPSDSASGLSAVPQGISSALVVDSSVAVAVTPNSAAAVGARMAGCSAALRDPSSGTRYLLYEAKSVKTAVDRPGGDSATTVDEQANYLPAEGESSLLPKGRYLRVACDSNRVLGLGDAFPPG